MAGLKIISVTFNVNADKLPRHVHHTFNLLIWANFCNDVFRITLPDKYYSREIPFQIQVSHVVTKEQGHKLRYHIPAVIS